MRGARRWGDVKGSGGKFSSVQFSSVRFKVVIAGSYALGKAHMRSTPSLRSVPKVALETVPKLFWLTMALSRPLKEDRRALNSSFYDSLLQATDGVLSL